MDDGELIIHSRQIEGQPPIKNFAGFRLSIQKLLRQTKPN
jgi:hypothetical protein